MTVREIYNLGTLMSIYATDIQYTYTLNQKMWVLLNRMNFIVKTKS